MSDREHCTPDTSERNVLLGRALASATDLLPVLDAGPLPAGMPEPAAFARTVLARVGSAAVEALMEKVAPRSPGLRLLESADPQANAALARLVRREVGDALTLSEFLPPACLVRWATNRLCGPDPLPDASRRAFTLLVAGVIRDLHEEAAGRTVLGDRPVGQTTLAQLAGTVPLETVASERSEAGLGLARASRELEAVDPVAGEVLLLACYAGQLLPEVAALTRRPLAAVTEQLADATDWARAQRV